MSRLLVSAIFVFALPLFTQPSAAQTRIDEWLVLGPMPAPATAGATDTGTLPDGFLSFDRNWPTQGDNVSWFSGRSFTWERGATQNGALRLTAGNKTVAYAAVYLTADRWLKAKIAVEGEGDRMVWLDGNPVSGDITLDQGSHWLLVQTQPASNGQWTLTATIETETENAAVRVSAAPRRAPTLAELELLPGVSGIEVDPAGRLGAFLIRHTDMENDRWVTTMQIRDVANGGMIRELGLGSQAMSPVWSRDGSKLAFLTITDKQGGSGFDVWVWKPEGGEARRLLRSEPGVGSLQFSADGAWLYFTGTVKPDSAANVATGTTRFEEVWERWGFWKDKSQLYGVHTDQGTRVTLSGDREYSINAPALSPDGRTFVYAREVRLAERPFLRVELWLLDITNLTSRKLLDLDREAFAAPQRIAWSPDGQAIAFCASSKNLLNGDEQTFNVFETELFLVSTTNPRLQSPSEDHIPSVGALGCAPTWTADGNVYVMVANGSHNAVARTTQPVNTASLGSAQLEILPLPGGETIGAYDVVNTTLVYSAESPVAPQTVFRTDLARETSRLLFDPTDNALEQADMPAMHDWSFTDTDGWNIDGWYLTPPGFDATRKYPVIVWYYGGTLATARTFDRRLAAWAAQGYVVYVLNPAGAPGWGQEFSDLHTNDWGYPAGSDIIEGVTKFAQEHSFVDASRIGNFGHSYGGFMTMHMATRTNIFAASVSIAGISNIANYWGAGWTGYSYTEGTCPGCFPWNRRDVYVERSPLFQADKITTPLLLIHGTDDSNVVPTESEQMFTALRVLDKETELVRFSGENHGVNSKPSVQLTRDSMLFEWFDKYLRGRPDAWGNRWSEPTTVKTVDATTPR